jgi:hypothetical protein
MWRSLIIGALACMAQSAQSAQAAEAGKVIFVAGKATIAERQAADGAAVEEGQMLSTGADGFLYVKTVDNGLFILRPNTRAQIVTYHVDTQHPENTRVKLELLNGVARSKSGDAVKQARQNFRFNTPVAAIGVRGTDFTVFTDSTTSRVAVISGAITMSGFAGACSADGGGPCEGATSRELTAAQRGQLLQVKRGQVAPQLLQSSPLSPDQVSPPRADEPLGMTESGRREDGDAGQRARQESADRVAAGRDACAGDDAGASGYVAGLARARHRMGPLADGGRHSGQYDSRHRAAAERSPCCKWQLCIAARAWL